MAGRAKIGLHLDTKRDDTKGRYTVFVRVSYGGQRKYYSIPREFELSEGRSLDGLTREEFEKVSGSKPRGDFKAIAQVIDAYRSRAVSIAQTLDTRFSFTTFEQEYLGIQHSRDLLSTGFTKYAKELREEGRISTAVTYECSNASIDKFKPKARYGDVTVKFLREYENWMRQQGNSDTTISIYIRCLRAIIKREKALPPESYPFGLQQHGKYQIPAVENQKKALTLLQVKEIRDFKVSREQQFARDIWLMVYYCNGINLKDLALLTHEQYDGETLIFTRAKSARTKKQNKPIVVNLNASAQLIIERHKTRQGSAYLLPVLVEGLTPEQEYYRIQDFRKLVNTEMTGIGKSLGIDRLTSYVGRHSFATVLRNKKFDIGYISEALGHTNLITTQRYLASFGSEVRQAAAIALDEL